MSEKLGRDEGIARVYQFLSDYGDKWKEDADSGKKDGVINSSELYGFLLKNVDGWNGENKYDTNDIITNFWKSIDTNVRGKMINGYSNSGHLDNNEIANMEKNLQITKVIREYVYDKSKISFNDLNLDAKYEEQFLDSMQASLLNKAKAHFASAQYDENNQTAFNTDVKAYLDTVKADSYRITAADYYKLQAIENAGKEYGYNASKDEKLDRIIESYITTIKNNTSVDFTEVKTAIDTLVNDYLSTAGLGNSTIDGSKTTFRNVNGQVANYATAKDRLAHFGYRANGALNDLQVKVLTKDLTDKIKEKIGESDLNNPQYKDAIKTAIENFINEKIASDKDFNTIKGKIDTYATEFATNKMSIIKSDAELLQLRNDTISYLDGIVAGGNSEKIAAVHEQFGNDYNTAILSMDKATINTKRTALDAKLATIKDPVVITDKSSEIKEQCKDILTGNYRMTFYMNNDGIIKFVNYDGSQDGIRRGAFSKAGNSKLNEGFNSIQQKLETTYAGELKSLNFDATEMRNLFQAALFMTVSDESVLYSQYNEQDVKQVVNALIDNYSKLLQKLASDTSDNTMNYIKNYHTMSIVAGRTPAGTNYSGSDSRNSDVSRGMDDYYMDDTTQGDDDAIAINKTSAYDFSYAGVSGQILHITTGNTWDDYQVNKGLDTMLQHYIGRYSKCLEPAKILSLFKAAEETAFRKISALTDPTKPAGTSLYGYGENKEGQGSDNFDTYYGNDLYNCGSVLLEVMYEMEVLIGREILK